jgi:ketosteroid isomerase-like protein
MTNNHTFLIALCCLVVSSFTVGAAEPSSSPPAGSEEARVIEVMRTFYVAATNDDLEKFHTVVTRDFYSYDRGARFTGDELMELIKKAHAAGKVFVWNVTKPEVRMHGDVAWITYVNEGSVKDASGTKNVTWLESAFLRKENDSWRIEFFHSTRVP